MHPQQNKTVKEVKKEILRTVKFEGLENFSLKTLELRMGETCLYETIEKALFSLVQDGKLFYNEEEGGYNMQD